MDTLWEKLKKDKNALNCGYALNDLAKKPPKPLTDLAKTKLQKDALETIYCWYWDINNWYDIAFNRDHTLDKTVNFRRSIAYFKILLKLEPRLINMRHILDACMRFPSTRESVIQNKDNLISYFINFDTSVNPGGKYKNEPSTPYELCVALWAYHEIVDDKVPVCPMTRTFDRGRIVDIAIHITPGTYNEDLQQFLKNDWEYIERFGLEQIWDTRLIRRKTPNCNIIQKSIIRLLISVGFTDMEIEKIVDEVFYSKNAIYHTSRQRFVAEDCKNYKDMLKIQSDLDWFSEAVYAYQNYTIDMEMPQLDLFFIEESQKFLLNLHMFD